MTPKPSLPDGIPLNEPQTEAGRELLRYGEDGTGNTLRDDILAIEHEARGIPLIPDTEALREALTQANSIIGSIRQHLARDHPGCAFEVLGIMNDDSRAALATPPASGGIPLIDVELLARAIAQSSFSVPMMPAHVENIAAEYTRLILTVKGYVSGSRQRKSTTTARDAT